MTALEWVERFNDRVPLNTDEHNSLVSLFAQAMSEAAAAERQACQAIVQEVTLDYLKGHDDYHVGGTDCGSDIGRRINRRAPR